MKEWEMCPKGVELETSLRALAQRMDDLAATVRRHGERLAEQDVANERLQGLVGKGGGGCVSADEIADAVAAKVVEKWKNGAVTWKQLALVSIGILVAASLGPEGLTALVQLLK